MALVHNFKLVSGPIALTAYAQATYYVGHEQQGTVRALIVLEAGLNPT